VADRSKLASYLIGAFGAFHIVASVALLYVGQPREFAGYWIFLVFGVLLLAAAALLRSSWGYARIFVTSQGDDPSILITLIPLPGTRVFC
jgi:hypothetical protein